MEGTLGQTLLEETANPVYCPVLCSNGKMWRERERERERRDEGSGWGINQLCSPCPLMCELMAASFSPFCLQHQFLSTKVCHKVWPWLWSSSLIPEFGHDSGVPHSFQCPLFRSDAFAISMSDVWSFFCPWSIGCFSFQEQVKMTPKSYPKNYHHGKNK